MVRNAFFAIQFCSRKITVSKPAKNKENEEETFDSRNNLRNELRCSTTQRLQPQSVYHTHDRENSGLKRKN